jgi:hypothetical protein
MHAGWCFFGLALASVPACQLLAFDVSAAPQVLWWRWMIAGPWLVLLGLWLLLRAGRAALGRWSTLRRIAVARACLPHLALASLLLPVIGVPLLRSQEIRWLAKDEISRPFAPPTQAEQEIAARLREAILKLLDQSLRDE